MKKISKTQILAALALAFVLGVAAPSAGAFASNDGIETYAADEATAAGLFELISEARELPDFTKALNLVNAYNDLASSTPSDDAVANAKSAITAVDSTIVTTDADAAALKARIPQMDVYKTWSAAINVINKIAKDTDATSIEEMTAEDVAKVAPSDIAGYYSTLNALVNPIPATIQANIAELRKRINTNSSFAGYRSNMTTAAAVDTLQKNPDNAEAIAKLVEVLGENAKDLSTSELIAKAEEQNLSLAKYVKLYTSMGFIREIQGADTMTVAQIENALNERYSTSELVNYYDAMASAAAAIDPKVTDNLRAYGTPAELPNTSVGDNEKPSTPNSGLIEMIENGSIDKGMVFIVIAGVVAAALGVGLVAKLYLKHKF